MSVLLIVDGETVFEQDDPCADTLKPSHKDPKLASDDVVLAQVRAKGGGKVYFQAQFHDGSRQSVGLVNVNINGLEDTFEESNKSARLSLAGEGNHYYTPATVVEGLHVYADNIHIGDLPDGWDSDRK